MAILDICSLPGPIPSTQTEWELEALALTLITSSPIEHLCNAQMPISLLQRLAKRLRSQLGTHYPLRELMQSQRRYAALLNLESRRCARDGLPIEASQWRLRSLRLQHRLLCQMHRHLYG